MILRLETAQPRGEKTGHGDGHQILIEEEGRDVLMHREGTTGSRAREVHWDCFQGHSAPIPR